MWTNPAMRKDVASKAANATASILPMSSPIYICIRCLHPQTKEEMQRAKRTKGISDEESNKFKCCCKCKCRTFYNPTAAPKAPAATLESVSA